MDGSAFSSPLESPEAPVTSSVVTLQSAESLSYRRQVRLLCSNEPVVNNNNDHDQTLPTVTPPPSEEQLLASEEAPTPSAVLTPSSPETSDAENSEDMNFLNFYEEPWDITNFQFDLRLLTLDGQFTES